MSKRLRKEIEDLEKRLKTVTRLNDFTQQSEIELELAELWKDTQTDISIQYYEDALKSSKKAKNSSNMVLAYRNLAELYFGIAESEEDYEKPFKYLKLQLSTAEEAKDHNLVQLAFHTLAQSYVTEAQRFSIESINLTKALFYARRCIDYLNIHYQTIDNDRIAVKTGRDSKRRRGGICSVLSDIYIKFGALKRSLEHITISIEYGLKHSENVEPLYLYRCYFVKLELLRGNACLELLETMRTYANKHKIKENRDILDRKYYIQLLTSNQNDVLKLCDVIDYFLKQFESQSEENADFLESVLKFLFSFMTLKESLSSAMTNKDRSIIYEEIGDKACAAEFFELGLKYYQEMLRYAELDQNNERIYLACGSIMETARNLHDYKMAHNFQQRATKLVRILYPNDADKIFFDECDLFFLDVRHGYNVIVDKDAQYHKFLSLIQNCDTYSKKTTVLEEFVLFLAFYDDQKELQRWIAELEKAAKLRETEPTNETDKERVESALKSSERYKLREFVSKIRNKKEREDVNWRNTKGETRLHEAAKIDNPSELEQLIRSGQNVNAVDYAGWTPLMEAVSYGHINNVRILCQNRADVNAASSEGLIDEHGNVGPSGITPMMDCCTSGNVKIARLLLRFGPDLDMINENGETAADLLRNYIEVNREDLAEKERDMCQSLLNDIEKKTRKRPSQQSSIKSQEGSKRFCNSYNFSM